jgi:hypothetical protein
MCHQILLVYLKCILASIIKLFFANRLQFTYYGIYETSKTVWRLLKLFFIWNIMYIRVPLICFKSYHLPNFDQFTRLQTVTCRFFVRFINMVFIFRTWRVEKSQLDIYRFNVSTDFSGDLKMHFGELKYRFLPTAPVHILWYIRNF